MMMEIREETESDAQAIRYVEEQAFNEEDEARVTDMLRASGRMEL